MTAKLLSFRHSSTVYLASGLLIAMASMNLLDASSLLAQQPLATDADQEERLIGADRLSDAFRYAAKILRPSVVTITSLTEPSRMQVRMGGNSFGFRDLEDLRGMIPDELFEQLRGLEEVEPEEPELNGRSDRRKVQTGLGSGVIVSPDGYILTNNHVVSRADELQVELSDGRTFEAEVIGTDSKSDVAVLKIDAGNLVAARLGDSSAMQVGDWVIAIGSPFGLDQTVTAGIISATNRQAEIISGGYEDFLQTDAAINPGNSGGPLINLRGEVIGINTAINSRTGTNAGVGFAIPSNMAGRIVEDLKSNGRVVRGYIGALLADVTAENAAEYRLPAGVLRGAAIEVVEKGGPADQGRLQPGDVVTSLNGRPIRSIAQLRNAVAMTRPGTQLIFEGFRQGQPFNLAVTTGELNEERISSILPESEIASMGIVVQELTPRMKRELETDSGVVVTQIDRRGAGAQMGIRPGDVILEINDVAVNSIKDLEQAFDQAENSYRMIIQRGNRLLSLQSTFR